MGILQMGVGLWSLWPQIKYQRPNNKSLNQEGFFYPPGLVLCQEEIGPEQWDLTEKGQSLVLFQTYPEREEDVTIYCRILSVAGH